MIIDGMQVVLMMVAHPTTSMLVTLIGYPISVRNDGILTIQVENNSFYNKINTKPIEALEANHYNGFKVLPLSFGAIKPIVVNPNVEMPMNLLSITPFHSIITTKFVPPDLRGDHLEPL
jgi:hypothetical protein